jgi:hypothetical protein
MAAGRGDQHGVQVGALEQLMAASVRSDQRGGKREQQR